MAKITRQALESGKIIHTGWSFNGLDTMMIDGVRPEHAMLACGCILTLVASFLVRTKTDLSRRLRRLSRSWFSYTFFGD